MEGDSAVQALFSVELEKLKAAGEAIPKQLQAAIDKTKADYDNWLDARYAAARGHCDAVIDPLDTRQILTMALEVTLHRPRAVPLVLETL
jgi:acetyl-CoA carboxylase carboxyltransferase component